MGSRDARIDAKKSRAKARLQNRRSRSSGARRGQWSKRWSEPLSHARSHGKRARVEKIRPSAGKTCLVKKKRAVAKEVYARSDLQNWRDVDPPIRLGLFGDPVEHSLSPQMQNAALKHCKIDMQYARFQISPNELRGAIDLIRKLEFIGVNLTIPHKIAALDMLDVANENVKRIGA